MTTPSHTTTSESLPETEGTVKIRAHGKSIRRMGHWTTATRFDVRASQSSVVLELRSPRIEPGDIEVNLDIDHSMVKLLVPEGAIIDDDELRRVGRCGLNDWSGTAQSTGRVIRVVGEMRRSELRINRGGIAIVSAMLTGEYLADLRSAFRTNHITSLKDMQDAYREGRWTTIDDPGRSA
ncbi:MAG TPA: hypothetical protein VJT14_14100 [Candidatus Dormibacteraeota bacterium]|nr:hypothetical protein [Candidatus Dormibacteraeota bacterium]